MKLISRIKGSKVAKTLIANFIYLSILKAISFLFPLITLPYLARVIGADSFGAIAFATSIMVIVETITDWGLNFTLPRPDRIDKMFEIADKLSQGEPHVRIDLYYTDGQIYFGETTFFNSSGYDLDISTETDKYFGSLMELPEKR